MSAHSGDDKERDRKRPRLSPPSPNSQSDKDEGKDPKNSAENEANQENQISVSLAPEVYKDFLEVFECPICNVSMYNGPILQCPEGHVICQECKGKLPRSKQCPQCRKKIGNIRNRALEGMAEKMPMPCKNKKLGCQLIVLPAERIDHGEQCKFAPIQCPHDYFDDTYCRWKGSLLGLDEHWNNEHDGSAFTLDDSVEMTAFTSVLCILEMTNRLDVVWFAWCSKMDELYNLVRRFSRYVKSMT
eukprot:912687_1